MAESILKTLRTNLGFGEEESSFDVDILTHMNTAFTTLEQLGLGPEGGFAVEDDSAVWSDFVDDDKRLNSVKTYIYLKVRLVFDPPSTSFHLKAIQDQIQELEWRLNTTREGDSWTPPVPKTPTDPEVIIVPSNQAWYSEP